VDDIERLARACAAAGFHKVVITGGEPMAHPQRGALLNCLAGLRQPVKPAQIVLRTNLAYPLAPGLPERLAQAFDQVVVSLDGDEASHDARRGLGTYAPTVENLRRLLESMPASKVLLTAVLDAGQIDGLPGQSVRQVGEQLGVKVRFKAVLPLGRGANLGLTPAYYNSLDDSSEALASSAGPMATCGLGMNLYIGPGGECYPCYALMGSQHALGNALQDGLDRVLKQNDRYRRVTVDSNAKCRACALRYLCGGFCRAWSSTGDADGAPQDCSAMLSRAQTLLDGALEILEISTDQWIEAGLPAGLTS
jgi:uncharacterized protein